MQWWCIQCCIQYTKDVPQWSSHISFRTLSSVEVSLLLPASICLYLHVFMPWSWTAIVFVFACIDDCLSAFVIVLSCLDRSLPLSHRALIDLFAFHFHIFVCNSFFSFNFWASLCLKFRLHILPLLILAPFDETNLQRDNGLIPTGGHSHASCTHTRTCTHIRKRARTHKQGPEFFFSAYKRVISVCDAYKNMFSIWNWVRFFSNLEISISISCKKDIFEF